VFGNLLRNCSNYSGTLDKDKSMDRRTGKPHKPDHVTDEEWKLYHQAFADMVSKGLSPDDVRFILAAPGSPFELWAGKLEF
jgi:hypothetical protein